MKRQMTVLACGVAGMFSVLGCGSETQVESAAESAVDSSGINGRQIYAQRLGKDHTIAFYDFGEGAMGIHEEGALPAEGKAMKSTMDSLSSWNTLADVFAQLNPNATSVPEAILAADQRMAAAVAEAKSLPRLPTSMPAAADPPQIVAAPRCSEDEDGDGWSGDWFLDTYCERSEKHICWTNRSSGGTNEYGNTRWSVWRQMEGDWREAGHIRGEIVRCNFLGMCQARTYLVNRAVPARRWTRWQTFDSRDRYRWTATSPCGHAHAAFSWEMN